MGTTESITKNLIYVGSSNFLQRFISLGSFLLLVRFLSLQEYGALMLLLSLASPIVALSSLGIGGLFATELALARGKEQFASIKKFVKEYAVVSLSAFLLIFLLAIPFKNFLLTHYEVGAEYTAFFYPIFIFALFQLALNFVVHILRSFERFPVVAISEGSEPLFRFFAICVVIFFFELNLTTAFAIYAASKVVSFIIAFAGGKKTFSQIESFESERTSVLPKILKAHGKWSVVKNILSQFTETIRLWLVKIFIDTESVAIFSVASKVMSLVAKVFPLQSIVTPLISRRLEEKSFISAIFRKTRKYYLLYFAIASVGIWLFMPYVLQIAAPQYVPHVFIFQLLSLALITEGLSVGQSALLLSHRRQKFVFAEFIITFIIGNSLTAYLLYKMKLVGLVLSVIVMHLISFAQREWYIRKRLAYSEIHFSDLFRFDSYDKMIVDRLKGLFLRRFKA